MLQRAVSAGCLAPALPPDLRLPARPRAPPADQPGLACVGDLNNTYPQWRRGGGGLVLHHPLLWQLLRLMAVDVGEP